MLLTDKACKNAKPGEKNRKITDGQGMYLEVAPNGSKYWRLKYRFAGKEKRLALGVYPEVSLKEARDKRDEARKLLASGVDPGQNRKAIKSARVDRAANTLEILAREYFSKPSPKRSLTHSQNIILQLEKNVLPWIGGRPIAEITPAELLAVLQRIEKRGAIETAHRTLQNCGQVFRYAVVTGRAPSDVTLSLKGALSPVKETHFAAITDPKAIGELLRAIDGYEGYLVVKCALRLAPLVFVRPGELRMAQWKEIDLEKAEWNIPAYRMKMKEAHLVPLSQQAIEILKELYPLTGHRQHVFPSIRSPNRSMSSSAILAALRRMGYTKDEMTGHGFRAMARTVLDEVLGVRPDFIEHQLAHAVWDPNGRAYNRTAHLAERKKMMQDWADYLDSLKMTAEVIPIKKYIA